MKRCSQCKEEKPLSDFRYKNISKNLRLSKCKICDKKHRAAYYKNNLEKLKEQNKKAELNRKLKVKSGEIICPDFIICKDCNITKSSSDFRWSNKKLARKISRCKLCDKKHRASIYHKHKHHLDVAKKRQIDKKRQIVQSFKNKPCQDCGVKYPPYVMDFDHRDPLLKIDKVSRMVFTHSKNKIINEIKKCDLICANCHRIRTYSCYYYEEELK